MSTITIPKKEYQELLDTKLCYDYLRQLLDSNLFGPSPTKSKKAVISAFRKTGRYNEKFLKSLEGGLKKSSYFKEV
jgi:hypothetical protein